MLPDQGEAELARYTLAGAVGPVVVDLHHLDPGKGEGGGGERGGGGARVAPPGVRHVHPVPDLQPVGNDAAMEPEGAGGDRTEEEAVDEVTSRVPLLLPAP